MTAATLAPIATSTEQVHAARQAYVEAQTQLAKRVVPELDAVIRACEELNLIDRKRAGRQLAAQANSALATADAYLTSVGKTPPERKAICYATGISAPGGVQDTVFAIMEPVLDALHPERIRLALIDAGNLHRTSGEVA
jgi:hypothetical protein